MRRSSRCSHFAVILVLLGTAGALANNQLGNNVQHNCAVEYGATPSNATTATSGWLNTSGADYCLWGAVGANKDLWTISGSLNATKLHRLSFTINSSNVGTFTEQWNASLYDWMSDQGLSDYPVLRTVAVDENYNAYTVSGTSGFRSFESFDSSGAQRQLSPGVPWVKKGFSIGGVAIAKPSGGSTRLGWAWSGTVIAAGPNPKAEVWSTSGSTVTTFPPAPGGGNIADFLPTGHPAVGSKKINGVYATERYIYFPGVYEVRDGTTTNVISFENRIMRVDTSTNTWETFYSNTTSGNVYGSIACDQASGAVYCWYNNGGTLEILKIDDTSKVLQWSQTAVANAVPVGATSTFDTYAPPAVGQSFVFARKPGATGNIRMIAKASGTASDHTINYGGVGPITVLKNGGIDYLAFKGGSTINCLQVTGPGTLSSTFTFSSVLPGTAITFGKASKTGAADKPVLYSWSQVFGGAGVMKAMYP